MAGGSGDCQLGGEGEIGGANCQVRRGWTGWTLWTEWTLGTGDGGPVTGLGVFGWENLFDPANMSL